ncbi:glycosyltransferase family 4 protein [Lentzea sp. NBC_00516]|uniref:glycosyltransferase family 4 protein n=1 Tax=Lentzea sp. NBC_00516 TaxID=2903582 RepID=UPI002E80E887|nr:glycosyltransferase family 4 protein [Lentzea sp. NBC_00516]WUD27187.1 glycosyltransferase family 4 protein [Lentzea sp. NBC_00516]
MRIVLVVPSLGVGGCERYVATIAGQLGQVADVVVVHQAVISEAMTNLLGSTRRHSLDIVSGTPDPINRFRLELASLQPDHIVAVLPLPVAEPGGPDPLDLLDAAAALCATTVVFQLAHLPDLLPPSDRRRAHRLLTSTDQRWIAVSAQNRSALASSFLVPVDLVSLVPNGTSTPPACQILQMGVSSPGVPILLQVGRLVRWKAQEDSIRALTYMTRPATLWLVGEGYDRERLADLAHELNVSDSVKFLGMRDDVDELMARADVVLHPTLAEGASFALLEAMAAARPIVASSAASNPELVRHGSEGWIHPAKRPDLQAAHIDDVLARPEEARRRALLAHSRVSTAYTAEGMISGLWSAIKRSI